MTFELDADEEVWIAAVSQVDRALWNVIDNAARYNTAAVPRVEVTVRADDDTVTVRDNGPGLAGEEIETLEAEAETKHRHGTGLWLVSWVLEKSGGSLTIDGSDGGSTERQANSTSARSATSPNSQPA